MTAEPRLKIYLAAPLFTPSERQFNSSLAEMLSESADIFLPQRDGKLLTDLVAKGHPVAVSQKEIYRADTDALNSCDIIVCVLDGRTIDEGVAFELGYARALGKTCVGFKSDDRCMLPTGDNPMIVGSCDYQVSSVKELGESISHICRDLLESSKNRAPLREKTTHNINPEYKNCNF